MGLASDDRGDREDLAHLTGFDPALSGEADVRVRCDVVDAAQHGFERDRA
jgi:hypothetical protein